MVMLTILLMIYAKLYLGHGYYAVLIIADVFI